mgnify:CR=1 FL=1
MKTAITLSMFAFVLFGSACTRNEGGVEKAGKKIDEAVDNVKDGDSPFHKKGAAEKAGEAIDNAVDSNRH